jgi:hypothetical protein
MSFDVSEVVTSGDIAESYTVIRSVGSFAVGGMWQENINSFTGFGIVSDANARDMMQVPEGDRIKGAMLFWSKTELFVSRNAGDQSGVADRLVWQGDTFKIQSVKRYPQRGYYRAIATRISGQ